VILLVMLSSFFLAYVFSKIAQRNAHESYVSLLKKTYLNRVSFSHNSQTKETSIQKNITVQGITLLEIQTQGSDVEIESSPDEQVHMSYVFQTEDKDIDNDENPIGDKQMQFDLNESVKKEGVVLKINLNDWAKAERHLNLSDLIKLNFRTSSFLRLKVPSTILKIAMRSTSANLKLEQTNFKNVQFESISGDLDVLQDALEHTKVDTVSGDIQVSGHVDSLTASTISGNVNIGLKNNSPNIDVSTTSGDLNLQFVKQPDIKVLFKTTSGDFHFDQPFKVNSSNSGTEQKISLGNAKSLVNFESVSGDLNIQLH